MKLHKSVDKRLRKISIKIKRRYCEGIKDGKKTSYYFHVRFYHLYLKRILWLIVNLLTLRTSTYQTLYNLCTNKYLPHITHPEASKNTPIKHFFRTLFGYNFLYSKSLLPVLPANIINKTRTISIAENALPVVSILIYASRHLSYTYNCLLALKENTLNTIKMEVILVDDHNDHETFLFLKEKGQGIKHIRNADRLGYSKSINKAVSIATGEFICLLNCDTEVRNGWLEPLIHLIQHDSSIACVGGKLLSPNKTLAEAGGILSEQGTFQSFGKNDDPGKNQYNFIREVDYCSTGSLLFRKADLESVGKLDDRFDSISYSIIDLCISFRKVLTKKVLYHPLSRLTQFESINTSSEMLDAQIKADYSVFRKKWAEYLIRYKVQDNIAGYRRFVPKSSIVVMEESLPRFDENARSLRLFRLLKALRTFNYQVILVLSDYNNKEPYYSAIINIGVEIRELNNESSTIQLDCFNNVKLIWIGQTSVNNPIWDKVQNFKSAKIIYELNSLRSINLKPDDILKGISKRNNLAFCREADALITYSETNKRTLDDGGVKNVYAVPSIYLPRKIINFKPFSQRSGILFIGNYHQAENIDAATWLAKEIMPLIWNTLPDVPLYLLGSNVPEEIRQFANDRISVSGNLHDISLFFNTSRLAVAPLRYSVDVDGIVGLSLEYHLPLISTSTGLEHFNLENEKDILVATDVEGFRSQILRLYGNEHLWSEISNNSYDALKPYSFDNSVKKLKKLFEDLTFSS